jgi:hypothetical protein
MSGPSARAENKSPEGAERGSSPVPDALYQGGM